MKKETKIALTAVVALVLLFVGINFLKGINVFKATNTYYVKFKDVAGLTVSTPVYANGYPVGIVRTIDYDYSRGEHVVVGIELDNEMRVPQQTTAELEAELMGGVKMTLINLIPRFYDATSGEILINGIDVRDYSFEYLNNIE